MIDFRQKETVDYDSLYDIYDDGALVGFAYETRGQIEYVLSVDSIGRSAPQERILGGMALYDVRDRSAYRDFVVRSARRRLTDRIDQDEARTALCPQRVQGIEGGGA